MEIRRKNRHVKLLIAGFIALVVLVAVILVVVRSSKTAAPKDTGTTSKKEQQDTRTTVSAFNKTLYSTTDPGSLWVVVNKQHPLKPVSYQSPDLMNISGQSVSAKMAASLQSLITDAKTQNTTFRVISGYRSYSYQTSLYNSYVAKDGQAAADTYSARPGYSEHQTGLVVDLGGTHGCDVEQCFGNTPEGQWLAANCYRYGFIVRYVATKQSVTGYQAESWHIRYIGTVLVNEMRKQNVDTLEEFFGVSGGTTYGS